MNWKNKYWVLGVTKDWTWPSDKDEQGSLLLTWMQHSCIKPFGGATTIFRDSYFNCMVADALAPCVTRSSATMTLTMQDKWVLVFHWERFQLPVPSSVLRNDRKCKYDFIFLKIILGPGFIFVLPGWWWHHVTVNLSLRWQKIESSSCAHLFWLWWLPAKKPIFVCHAMRWWRPISWTVFPSQIKFDGKFVRCWFKYHYKILLMPWQRIRCRGMCKNLLPTDGHQLIYSNVKFPFNLNFQQNLLVKCPPG